MVNLRKIIQMPQLKHISRLKKGIGGKFRPKYLWNLCGNRAGQETVRHFFRAGGASGTIAKAMSAYDKDYSDAIYGKGRT